MMLNKSNINNNEEMQFDAADQMIEEESYKEESLENQLEKKEVILGEEIHLSAPEKDDDDPADPAVHADSEEQSVATKEAAKGKSKGGRRRSKTSQNKTPQPVAEAKAVQKNNMQIGIEADLVPDDSIDNRTELEKEEDIWKTILRQQDSHGLLWGVIRGVEPDYKNNTYYVVTTFQRKKVRIPEIAFAVRDLTSHSKYYELIEGADAKETAFFKSQWRANEAKKYIGAVIPFTIIASQRIKVENKNLPEGFHYRYNLMGSRKEGMEILQDYWFFHTRKRFKNREAQLIKNGDIIDKANILMVEENGVMLEVCGCEVFMESSECSDTYIENCRKVYKPGMTLPVMLRQVSYRMTPTEKSVYMRPSGRLAKDRYAQAKYDEVEIGGMYSGTVALITKKGNYIIKLDNGVTCMVTPVMLSENVPLNVSNRVVVRVNKKFDDECSVRGVVTRL